MKLYNVQAMTEDDLDREFARLDQERRMRTVAARNAHRQSRAEAVLRRIVDELEDHQMVTGETYHQAKELLGS